MQPMSPPPSPDHSHMSAIKSDGRNRSPRPSVGQDQTDGSSPAPDPTLPILDPIAEIDKVDQPYTRPETTPFLDDASKIADVGLQDQLFRTQEAGEIASRASSFCPGRRAFRSALRRGMLVSTGGCSGSSDMQGPAGRDEEGQKLLQERMKENMAKKGAMKGQRKKRTREMRRPQISWSRFLHFVWLFLRERGHDWRDSPRLHAHRASGRHRHHRGFDRVALAGRSDRRGEAARRGQCLNNLKQIGMALANYHTATDCFPMATTIAYSDPGVQTNWGTWSCQALLLSYLDNQPLYSACNFSWNCWYDVGYNVNSTVFNTKVAFFLCPSDDKAGRTNTNNYMACMGAATNPWTLTGSGVFSNQTCNDYSTLRDGSSSTIAYSEALVSDSNHGGNFRDGVAAGNGSRVRETTPRATCRG